MKKIMLGMMALCAATAFGDLKIGTVDMMTLVRNHKNYDTNKKILQGSEKDYQKELDSMKAELDALQDEGKKIADQARNPMISQAQKDKIEKELLDIQNKYVAGQQKLRSKAMESQQKLQELETQLLKITTEEIRAVVNKFAEDNDYERRWASIPSTPRAGRKTMKASELAKVLGGTLEGEDVELSACGGLEEARPGDLSFCKDPKHVKLVESTKASAVLLPPEWDKGAPCSVIRVADPNHACMAAAKMFAPPEPVRAPGVHSTAIVDPSVKLGKDVHIGPFTVIEKGAEIGDGAVIEAQVFIGEGCKVGAKTHIYPQVTLREGTIVGADCIIHCGVRLGGDGYGFNNGRREDGSVFIEKIPQLGIVEIGDGVEIGSNTTIDRARIGRTYIGPMTKIDNLVQIGHNVKVKGYSGLIAQSGVAGSTEIGYGCLIWAQAGISGHIKIADGVQVGPQAGVPQSLDGSLKYVIGAPAMSMKDLAAITLAPKMIQKLKGEVKELKAQLAAK